MKQFTLILIALTLTACARDPHQRDIVADIIARSEYDTQQTTVTIVDRDVALKQLASEMPITHVKKEGK